MPATEASPSTAPAALKRLLHAGVAAQDPEELRLSKVLLNLGNLLFVLAVLLWLAVCRAVTPGFPVLATLAVAGLSLANLLLFAGHRGFAPYRFIQLALLL